MKVQTKAMIAVLVVAALGAVAFRALGIGTEQWDDLTDSVVPGRTETINISMASSITKWEWLEQAVESFNGESRSNADLQVDGKPVEVEILLEADPLTGTFRHWNSPTQVTATLRGDITPTILSPASATWILKLNSE
jgi:hypothetical protein